MKKDRLYFMFVIAAILLTVVSVATSNINNFDMGNIIDKIAAELISSEFGGG